MRDRKCEYWFFPNHSCQKLVKSLVFDSWFDRIFWHLWCRKSHTHISSSQNSLNRFVWLVTKKGLFYMVFRFCNCNWMVLGLRKGYKSIGLSQWVKAGEATEGGWKSPEMEDIIEGNLSLLIPLNMAPSGWYKSKLGDSFYMTKGFLPTS